MQIIFKINDSDSRISENQLIALLLNTEYKEIIINKCGGSEKLVKVTFTLDNKLAYTNLLDTLKAIGIQCQLSKSCPYHKVTTNDFPPSDKIKYNYKNCDPEIAETISNVLQTNPHFYNQTMHLLNKFNINLAKEKKSNVIADSNIVDESSDDDSEIEETMVIRNPEPVVKQFKREPYLKRPTVLGIGKIQMKFLKKK